MDFNALEEFLKNYQNTINILIVPTFIGFWYLTKWILKLIRQFQKRIRVHYIAESNNCNPNYCITSLKIANNKNKKFIGDKIEIIFFDDMQEYSLVLYSNQFIIEPENLFETKLKKVSHYYIGDKFVDLRYLLIKKQFYFNIYNDNKIIHTDKKWYKKRKKIRSRITTSCCVYANTTHSLVWDYGFKYKDIRSGKEHIGFMNQRQIACPHLFTEIATKDEYTPQNLIQILANQGLVVTCIDQLKRNISEYRKIIPQELGKIEASEIQKQPVHITDKDILNFEVHNGIL